MFIADFLYILAGSHPRNEYLVHRRGWIDLLGSILKELKDFKQEMKKKTAEAPPTQSTDGVA